jgi:NAD(P)-dependent dehydrogenase (short-subunit alcohol dehydrogenase family)
MTFSPVGGRVPPSPAPGRGRLEGKVAIVTGAGSEGDWYGTGGATAIAMAACGARVAVVDVSAPRAQATVAAIESAGGEAMPVAADVTSGEDCRAAAALAATRFGAVTVLVNNLGAAVPGSVTEVDEDSWNRALALNLTSVMLMSGSVVPQMTTSGGGSIVNVSSIASMRGSGRAAAYAAAKGGVNALTVEMAVAHGRQGIRVNALLPGHLHTPIGALAGDGMRDLRRRAGLLGTEGDAFDVAWAAVFLASDEARYITAALLPVDAGATAVTPLAMLSHLR